MKPVNEQNSRLLDRRLFLGLGLGSLAAMAGCKSPLMRGQTPEQEDLKAEGVDEKEKRDLVGSYTRPFGLNKVKLESVGLVTNLDYTGSDPPPSAQRDLLLNEMLQYSVENPEELLSRPTTSMVIVRGFLPPGIRRGELFDVEVRAPTGSGTTSLRGGWLMKAQLRQVEILAGSLHTGNVEGIVDGDVIDDAIFEGEQESITKNRGVVLGRAVAQRDRDLGLAIRTADASFRIVRKVEQVINARFFTVENGSKKGVAEGKRNNFLILAVPANYRHNMGHYLRVVRNIALSETPVQRLERISVLEKKLLEPTTTSAAAVSLEAIGKEAIPALKRGLISSDTEVRFCSAEALAYFDEAEAAPVLGQIAKDEPAFRWYALAALSSMLNSVTSLQALSDLLHVTSAETRYGAFRALRLRSTNDPTTKGEFLAPPVATSEQTPRGGFRYHLVASTSEPLIHISRSLRPEIVVFGHEQRLHVPGSTQWIEAGPKILIKGDGDRLRVSRFGAGESGDKVESCSTLVDEVIRSIVKVGGSYADVIAGLRNAHEKGLLETRIAVEALPKPTREYEREEEESVPSPTDEKPAEPEAKETVASK
ncbi:MAG: HEAT repeat domain-containing protein [Pirellulaceae bacterium]